MSAARSVVRSNVKMQRGHRVDVQSLEQPVAQKPGSLVQRGLVSTGSPVSRLKYTLACA
jgi:hypothetical protein